MNKILLGLVFLLLAGCGNRNGEQFRSEVDTAAALNFHDRPANKVPLTRAPSGVVEASLENGKSKLRIVKEPRKTISVRFESGDYKFLNARIRPAESPANVRFSQILMPDGGSDGPFGDEISYQLDEPGKYTLIIGESLMAGEPWGGEFRLDICLGN